MKNQKIIKAKKLINSIDSTIQVVIERKKYKYGLTCEPTESKIYIGFRATKIENQTFIDYVNEIEKDFFSKYNISLWEMSILHEIGHIMTHNEELEEDYNFSVEMLNQLHLSNKITDKQKNELYTRLDLETLATQWAIDYVKQNR